MFSAECQYCRSRFESDEDDDFRDDLEIVCPLCGTLMELYVDPDATVYNYDEDGVIVLEDEDDDNEYEDDDDDDEWDDEDEWLLELEDEDEDEEDEFQPSSMFGDGECGCEHCGSCDKTHKPEEE